METDTAPAGEAGTAPADGRSPVLDAHSHLAPAALLESLATRPGPAGLAAEAVEAGWRVTVPWLGERLLRPGMFDPQARERAAAARGVDARLLCPWLDLQAGPDVDAATARQWSARVNEALVATAGPPIDGRVPALASVALHDPDAAAEDLAVAVRDLGMAGLVLMTDPEHCSGLDDPRLDPLWSAAEELDVVVMLHPGSVGPSRALPDSAEYGNAWCRLVDTTFALSRLLLAGTLDRHPDLRLLAVHGGGFLPYQARRLDGAHRADALAVHPLPDAPSSYLSRMWFDTVALAPESIALLAAVVGTDRVVLGSDEPFPLGDPDPVGAVRAAGLDPDATAAVLGGNLLSLVKGRARV